MFCGPALGFAALGPTCLLRDHVCGIVNAGAVDGQRREDGQINASQDLGFPIRLGGRHSMVPDARLRYHNAIP